MILTTIVVPIDEIVFVSVQLSRHEIGGKVKVKNL